MISNISSNTQAALLLTAPLLVGKGQSSAELLTPIEYRRLARQLRDRQLQPGALLSPEAEEVFQQCRLIVEEARLRRLLGRGFLLSQALDRWETRALWVVSLSDPEYPRRLRERLREEAPPVLYGCGDLSLLERGGLAVVGSRNANEGLLAYAGDVGRLAAMADRPLISGGARGIDQASMRGALGAGGTAVGVLADSLERTAMTRDHRDLIADGQLVLISPYDPGAGFNVGNAMRRNKLIYALADAALVVSADLEKGGTWAGAIEQLDKLRLVPVYVRLGEPATPALDALQRRGAFGWPAPHSPQDLVTLLGSEPSRLDAQSSLPALDEPVPREIELSGSYNLPAGQSQVQGLDEDIARSPAEHLFTTIRELLRAMPTPQTEDQVAALLGVNKSQARAWLTRLVDEGVLVRHSRPARYSPPVQTSLIDHP